MALTERLNPNASPSSPKTDHEAALATVERQLELAGEDENPIERFFKGDALLELQDERQAETDTSASPLELS